MSNIQFIQTLPSEENFHLFENFPKQIYPSDSPRFTYGHDPVPEHLKACYLLQIKGEIKGRFALYVNPNLKYQNQSAACIGSYECVDHLKVSNQLISFAIQKAKETGAKWVIGPMEGSTWNNYRFSEHNNAPNFFLEPYHHSYYTDQWKKAGFSQIAAYVSQLDTKLEFDAERLQKFEHYYAEKGAKFRHFNLQNASEELHRIGDFCIKAFAENFLYTPIKVQQFVEKYTKILPYLDPRLIWIVEDEKDEIQALLFNVKDHMNSLGDTIIIKSMARSLTTTFKGIGSYLTGKTYQIAHELGYKKVIHALMINTNDSLRISNKYHGEEYKSYSLMGKQL